MQTVLLDTDYVIDFLSGVPEAKKCIVPLLNQNIAFLSILSVYELYAGMRPDEERATDYFIQACRIEPVTVTIAKKAGIHRFKYRQQGITLSVVDCIISETARTHGHHIATHNKKHYPRNFFLESN